MTTYSIGKASIQPFAHRGPAYIVSEAGEGTFVFAFASNGAIVRPHHRKEAASRDAVGVVEARNGFVCVCVHIKNA